MKGRGEGMGESRLFAVARMFFPSPPPKNFSTLTKLTSLGLVIRSLGCPVTHAILGFSGLCKASAHLEKITTGSEIICRNTLVVAVVFIAANLRLKMLTKCYFHLNFVGSFNDSVIH